MSEKSFYRIKKLLEQEKANNELVAECLSEINQNVISFHCFEKPSEGNQSIHIKQIYETRYQFNKYKCDESSVIGYDMLMPRLRSSDLKNIKISSITSKNGTYLVFSNFEVNFFIGILKTIKNIDDLKRYQSNLRNDLIDSEKTFIKGKLLIRRVIRSKPAVAN